MFGIVDNNDQCIYWQQHSIKSYAISWSPFTPGLFIVGIYTGMYCLRTLQALYWPHRRMWIFLLAMYSIMKKLYLFESYICYYKCFKIVTGIVIS